MKKANIIKIAFLSAVIQFAANDESFSQSNTLAYNGAAYPEGKNISVNAKPVQTYF